MAGLTARSTTLAGWAGVVVVGALVALGVVLLAGGGSRTGWVVVAGAAACASGLAYGATQRLLPALVLAVVAGGALAIAASGGDDEPASREQATPARVEVAGEQERSRGNASESERPTANVARAGRPTPRQFVRGYYAAIEAGRYEETWSRLSAAVPEQSPDFDDWRAGYATTVSQRVEDFKAEPGGVVRYVLVAVDRTPCGTTTEQRFEVRWRLVPAGRSYTATSLGAVKLEGLDPIAAC